MGTKAGLPTLNPKLDTETVKLIKLLDSINNHGFAKIIYTTKGETYSPKFNKDGSPDLKKNGEQKMTKGGFLKTYADITRKEKRPTEIMQPNGKMISIKEITALVTIVINVKHDYVKLIQNQLKADGFDPNSFNPEACKYSSRFTNNGLVRQNINPAKDKTFYFRYFTGINAVSYRSYTVVYLNENGDTVELDQEFKNKWFNGTAPSQKQAEVGISKEIKPRNLGLDNLMYFQKGQDIFNSRLTPEIMKLLNLEYVY